MIAVLKHELSGYFHSLSAYIFGAFLLVFVGIGAMFYNIYQAVANFEYVLNFVSLVFVIIIPILTMRVIAEERKQKTDQLLYSLPITTTQLIAGKYIAMLIVYFIPLCIISLYPLIFAQFGEVYLPASYSSLFAFFIMGAALIAVGTFISSLTTNQGSAAGISVLVLLFNYYSASLAEYVSSTTQGSLAAIFIISVILGVVINFLAKNKTLAYITALLLMLITIIIYINDKMAFEDLLPDIMEKLSLFERFNTFVNGVFDASSIVYYVTTAIFFLFLAVQSLEKRRYN